MGGAVLCSGLLPLCAQTIPVPKFFDPRERFERPHLTNLPRLRFLTTVDFPPFNYIDRNGQLSGYNIDLARAICSELKVEDVCQIEALPWDEMIARLNQGGGDAVIAGLAPTAENRAELAFTRPYMRFPARFVALQGADPAEPFSRYIQSQRIGVVENTVHEKMLSAYFPEADVVAVTNGRALYQALKEKLVGVAFGDGMTFSLWLNEPQAERCCKFVGGPYLGIGYLGEGMRIAVTKRNHSLALAMDYAMQSLERKGKLTELYLRYFPISFY